MNFAGGLVLKLWLGDLIADNKQPFLIYATYHLVAINEAILVFLILYGMPLVYSGDVETQEANRVAIRLAIRVFMIKGVTGALLFLVKLSCRSTLLCWSSSRP